MIWFVTRHAGAREWAARQGVFWDRELTHWENENIRPGDRVYGTLPCQIAASVCDAGAEYWHLELSVASISRGCELTADEVVLAGARCVRYEIKRAGK
jgi:CRISPR-associated protein Csx16